MIGAQAPAKTRYAVDLGILLSVLSLLAIGVAMVFSASFVVAQTVFGDDTYFLVRHIIWVVIGLVVLMAASVIDYHFWQKIAVPLYIVTIGLLLLVLLPGFSNATYGASRWISLGPLLSLQP